MDHVTGFRIVVVVILKGKWLWAAAQSSLLLYDIDYRIILCYIFCRHHTKRRLGWDGAGEAFFWYDSKKDLITSVTLRFII